MFFLLNTHSQRHATNGALLFIIMRKTLQVEITIFVILITSYRDLHIPHSWFYRWSQVLVDLYRKDEKFDEECCELEMIRFS